MNKLKLFLKKIISSAKWIHFISERFSKVDRKGRSAVTSALASLGVCLGVLTLIVTISVMNGFQSEFINAIMEISSYHVRVTGVEDNDAFNTWCARQKKIKCVTPFYEAQGLLVSAGGKQSASLVRAIEPSVMLDDEGFARECQITMGEFDLTQQGSIVLGSELARKLGARVGSMVSILALSGSSDVNLISQNRLFVVKGVFHSGYSDINASYAYISISDGKRYFGQNASLVYGVKLADSTDDAAFVSSLAEGIKTAKAESWRTYNRTFFGALRVEKNMLLLLVLLIFVVVAINIYNGMRRMVFERSEEIAVISALGGKKHQIQEIFIMQGFLTGIKGSLPGLVLGLFICSKMKEVFFLLSKAVYFVQYFGAMIVSPQTAYTISENPMFMVYGEIPAHVVPSEILLITFFGIFSSLAASWVASRGVLKMTVAEVLRNE